MPYIYHAQIEVRIIQQVEVESEAPLTVGEISARAMSKFNQEYGGHALEEIAVGEIECVAVPSQRKPPQA